MLNENSKRIEKIGIIYGSDTGVTEEITHQLVDLIQTDDLQVIDVSQAQESDFLKFDLLLIGLSTWYYGELQSDWEDFFEKFKTIDFTGKTIAMYGVGDQYGYTDYFIDGVGILAQVILKNGGAIIGNWPSKDYDFSESKALKDENTFYGLAIDEDNESDLTDIRLEKWVSQLRSELNIETL